jgi:CRISPR-associated protein Cst2
VHTEDQLAVKFKAYPDPDRFVDDFLLGYFLALDAPKRKAFEKARGKGIQTKRDSILMPKGVEHWVSWYGKGFGWKWKVI